MPQKSCARRRTRGALDALRLRSRPRGWDKLYPATAKNDPAIFEGHGIRQPVSLSARRCGCQINVKGHGQIPPPNFLHPASDLRFPDSTRAAGKTTLSTGSLGQNPHGILRPPRANLPGIRPAVRVNGMMHPSIKTKTDAFLPNDDREKCKNMQTDPSSQFPQEYAN